MAVQKKEHPHKKTPSRKNISERGPKIICINYSSRSKRINNKRAVFEARWIFCSRTVPKR